MSRLMILLLMTVLFACGASPTLPKTDSAGPVRIVSLDYCADQYVLKFAERDRIRAVSPDAPKDFSYMREAARGIPTVRPIAEDVLLLKPDLVVRSYGGGPGAETFFKRAGVPVLEVGWAGDFPAILANTQRMADALGAHEAGAMLVSDIAARLDALSDRATGQTALYMTPTGITSGPGSLVHEIMLAAGLENFQTQSGWRPLPLERLVREQPDIVATAFFGSPVGQIDAWSAMNHPVARAQLKQNTVVPLEAAWTSCNGWFLIEAVEALAKGASE